jgi:hypothetical protein
LRLTEVEVLSAMARGEEQSAVRAESRPNVVAAEDVAMLRDLPELWAEAREEERADLVASTYDSVVDRDDDSLSVRITSDAYPSELTLARRSASAVNWLARKDSNLQSPDPESGALPLGHSPAMPVGQPRV